MHKETFYIDGVDARSVGISLQRPVEFSEPVPVVKTEQIPGRNGNIVFDEGNYENRIATASCFALDTENVIPRIREINKFLFSGGSRYRRLETSDEPDYFWMARVENGARTEQRMRRLAPFDISFDCKPQKFAKSGESSISVQNGSVVYNAYGFDALPLVKIVASTTTLTSHITIGNATISIAPQWWGYVSLNSRLEEKGASIKTIADNLSRIGVTAREFGVSLDACDADVNSFIQYISEFSDHGTTEEDILSALVLDKSKLGIVFGNEKNHPSVRLITVDCDELTSFNALCNQNHNVGAPVFPVLNPGENVVSWDNAIESVEITPRWWCL